MTLNDRQRGWAWIALGPLAYLGGWLIAVALGLFFIESVDTPTWSSYRAAIFLLSTAAAGYVWLSVSIARGLGWLGFSGHTVKKLHRSRFPVLIGLVVLASVTTQFMVYVFDILPRGQNSFWLNSWITDFLGSLGPLGEAITLWLRSSDGNKFLSSGLSFIGQFVWGLASLVSFVVLCLFSLGSTTWIKTALLTCRQKFSVLIGLVVATELFRWTAHDLLFRMFDISNSDSGFVFELLSDILNNTLAIIALLWLVVPRFPIEGEAGDRGA